MARELLARIDAIAERSPAATAVIANDASLTQRELVDRSQALATRLAAAGVCAGDVVALSLGRTSHHVVAMLAAWRLGAAFLPLDPAAPPARREALLAETRARVHATLAGSSVALESLPRAAPLGAPAERLAYVVATSGSTGAPKCVRVSHRGLVPMLDAQIAAFGLAPGKRAGAVLSFAFDASISDVGTALLAGATLVVPAAMPPPAQLASFLAVHRITHADLPPSILAHVDPATLPPTLETVVIGGEVAPARALCAWARVVRVVNVYGPTEATICTHLGVVDPEAWTEPLLGHPLPHVVQRIEDGELWLGGPAVALGYVDRPELERAKFCADERGRWFRTGDRVESAGDRLVFRGRIDRQLKLRGQLVAPEELEASLHEHAAVRECAVELDGAALVARVVATDVDAPSLRAHLEARLPSWMIPRIELVGSLARGTTGKVSPRTVAGAPAADGRTTVIARAFAEVLGRPSVDPDDDFATLGGDSLGALAVVAAAALEGVFLAPSAVLELGTPRAIARSNGIEARTFGELEDEGTRLARELTAPVSAPSAAAGPSDAWLVTGATGFLGGELLPALLARTSGTVHCLVRARDGAHARARLGRLADDPRVVVHAGDVGLPSFGLARATWEDLARDVGHVLHTAAAVNLVLPYPLLAQSNVRGAFEIARFARAGRTTSVDFVSSLAVLAATDGAHGADAIEERTRLGPTARVFGGYTQTKVVAEALLRAAVPRLRIVRPGLLTGDSRTGRSARSCQLAAFLRQTARLGCIAKGAHERLRVDVTPVDHAARMIAAIVTSHDPAPIVHVSSRHGATLAELVRALRSSTPVAEVEPSEVVARAKRELPQEIAMALVSSSRRLLGHPHHDGGDLFLATDRSFDGALAERITGQRVPVADAALLARYVADALGATA